MDRVHRARLGDQPLAAHAASSASSPKAVCSTRTASSVYSSGDQHRDLDLRGRDGKDVDPRSARVSNILAAMPGVGAHADADRLTFTTSVSVMICVKSDRRLRLFELGDRLGQAGRGHGEGELARRAGPGAALDDHVDIDVRLRERREDRRDRAGLVGKAGQRDPRLVLVMGDAGDELPFHVELLDSVVEDDQRPGPVLERRKHLKRHVVAHCKPDRAGLQHLGADRRELEHLLIGDRR